MFLTIDWDFFITNRGESELDGKTTNGDGEEIHNIWLYDWSAHESRAPSLCDILWHTRASGFIQNKLDIEEQLRIESVSVADFAEEILNRFDLEFADAWLSDSHAWGAPLASASWALNDREPVHVVSFDAHCDLGYSESKVNEEDKKGHSDCGSWLYHALKNDRVASAEIVYPDWKGLVEWEQVKGEKFLEPFLDRIQPKTWSDFLRENREYPDVSNVHLCRSSAWTPPWLDDEFLNLANRIHEDYNCLDHPDNPWGQQVGGFDSSVPRDWDRAYIQGEAQRMAEMMKQHREKAKQDAQQ